MIGFFHPVRFSITNDFVYKASSLLTLNRERKRPVYEIDYFFLIGKNCISLFSSSGSCVDNKKEKCDKLVEHGLCEKKKVLAINHCRRSCHKCG